MESIGEVGGRGVFHLWICSRQLRFGRFKPAREFLIFQKRISNKTP